MSPSIESGDSERAGLPFGTAAQELRRRLLRALERAPAECLLLSGGLDTSILAPFANSRGTHAAVTVLLGPDAPDRTPAIRIAKELGWKHYVIDTNFEEILAEVELVVRVLRTFDPMEIRNSVVIARALRAAREHGHTSAMVGDGADELFGGYEYMIQMPDQEFEEYSRRLALTMTFSAGPLGEAVGIEISSPYTDPEVVEYAVTLPRSAKIGEHDGTILGKMILRTAFPEAISRWRRKDPIEVGSGTTRLPTWFAKRTSVQQFERERAEIRDSDRIEIRDPEHLAYYRVFRKIFGSRLSEPRFTSGCCAHCGFPLAHPEATFCRTCGAYPALS